MSDLATDAVAPTSLTDAYIPEESKILDPSILDKTLIERMPNPAGWRLLILPYKGKGKTDAGILLTKQTTDRESLSTVVAYVLKIGPLAYQDESKFAGEPWCKEGDWVLVGKYAGARFSLEEDAEVRIINDDEIIGTILDPDDIKAL